MSLLIVVLAVVVAVLFAAVGLLMLQHKREKERTSELLKRFSRLGSTHNLSFSSQEVLHSCVIGLDGLRRKLLLLKWKRGRFVSHVIELDKLKRCTTERVYERSGKAGEKGKPAGVYLEQVVLQLECANEPRPVEIIFYDHRHDPFLDLPLLNRKAKDWEIILSKMTNNRLSKTT